MFTSSTAEAAEAVSTCEIVLATIGAATATGAATGAEAATEGAGAAVVAVFLAVRLAGAAVEEDISFMLMVEEVLQEYKRGECFPAIWFSYASILVTGVVEKAAFSLPRSFISTGFPRKIV